LRDVPLLSETQSRFIMGDFDPGVLPFGNLVR